MNQEKTGKFIARLRKNKNMTQEQLAEKMGVSINAVSKWERGLSFPDVSLYKQLCNELDISIEELINGEKDNSEEAKEKAIISAIKKSNKIKKNSNIKVIIISIVFLLFTALLVILNNKEKINLVDNFDYLYDIAIDYLRDEEFKNNPDSKMPDFNVFYSYHGFGIEEKNNYKYAYMWVYSQSYYLEEGDSLAIAGGMSIPIKITFKDDKVVTVEVPKDGGAFVESIKDIFPSIIANQVLSFDTEKNINRLFNEVSSKKNKYYDYLNLDMSKITVDDISYDDVIFYISIGNKTCIPVNLVVYENNKYKLFTAYKACKSEFCTAMLSYTKSIEGMYNYDVIQIIRHSTDANYLQFTNDNLPKYEIHGGNGYMFITDNDNKYLNEFLRSINVDLLKCAEPDYES